MGGEGCEGKYCNFPYRKSFTPDLWFANLLNKT